MAEKFFLYARKSTDSEERQILSIEAQIAELRILAEKEGLSIIREFTEAMTAKVPGRPIFNEMISRIEKGEAQGIIAWHPDRLARNSVDGGRVIYLLDTGHIKFLKFPTFWFENTPQGKFMMNIAFGQSKYYVDNLSENIRRGQRQKIRRGEFPGLAPLGYLNDPISRKIVVDPIRAPLIKKLFEEYATGKFTVEDMKRAASEWGLMSRPGKNLFHSMIYRILTKPFYYGLGYYSGESFQGSHEPLITKELFDKVQKELVRAAVPHKHKKHLFSFLGLAVCSTCGGAITAERQKGHHYYRCTKKMKVKCTEPYVREEKLAEQIKAAIAKVALPDQSFQKLMAYWAKEQESASQPVTKLKTEMATKIPEVKLKLDRLLDAHLEGLIEKTEYLPKKETLLKKKIDLEERLKRLEQEATGWLEPCREFLEAAHQAGQMAAEGNLESQKEFLKKIGSNFRLAAKSLVFSYLPPWRLVAAADFENLRRGRDSNPRYPCGYTTFPG